MDSLMSVFTWRPDLFSGSGEMSDISLLIMALMSFVGAGIVMRLTQVESSFNFLVNYSVMFIGCVAFKEFGAPVLFPMQNEIIASTVTANFGMTLAGFVLLLAYRNSN